MEELVAYVDGSTLSNGRPGARSGIGIYVSEKSLYNTSARLLSEGFNQTNQVSELVAVAYALVHIPDDRPLCIITDSTYAIGSCTTWREGWKRKQWKIKNTNLTLQRRLSDLLDERRHAVRFVHVLGHTGNFGNGEADRLANAGARNESGHEILSI